MTSNQNPVTTPPDKRDGRKENANATQAALRKAGFRLFSTLGYEATPVGALCAEAGVTTGALYHHYGDKKRLFAAVAEELECMLVRNAMQAHQDTLAQGGSAWDAFLAGIDTLLVAGTNTGLRRIGLVDAPAVLGAEVWRAIREQHGHGALTASIQALQAQGWIAPGDPNRIAWLLLGMIYSALQSLPEDRLQADAALSESKRLIHAMLDGLRTPT
ncbi:MAG TPA: TetR/AcrR family transcriptional regulator [Noviherbaspirillum sp.]